MNFCAFIVYIDYASHASIWISKLYLWPLTFKASLYSHCFSRVKTFSSKLFYFIWDLKLNIHVSHKSCICNLKTNHLISHMEACFTITNWNPFEGLFLWLFDCWGTLDLLCLYTTMFNWFILFEFILDNYFNL